MVAGVRRLPRWARWAAAGPVVGAALGLVMAPALYLIGIAVHRNSGAYRINFLGAVVAGAPVLGLVGGALTGIAGGFIIWLVDRFGGDRRNGRIDAKIAATIAAAITSSFAVWQLSAGVEQTWDVAFWLVPVPVAATAAGMTAGWIWRTANADRS